MKINKKLCLYLTVIFVIIIVVIFFMKSRVEFFDLSDMQSQLNGITSTNSTYVPTQRDVWDSSPSGTYTCPGKGNTSQPGYCMVQQTVADDVCNADPNCAGYLVPGSTEWKNNFPGQVQLIGKNNIIQPNPGQIGSVLYSKTSGGLLPPQPLPTPSIISEMATRIISLINGTTDCQSLTSLKSQILANTQLTPTDLQQINQVYNSKFTTLSCSNSPKPSPQPFPSPTPSPQPFVPSGNIPSSSLMPSFLDGVFVAKYVGPIPQS